MGAAMEMVKVNLDVQRMYRANHEDRTAITVGPGEGIEVPRWVADEWAKPHPDQRFQPVGHEAAQAEIARLTAEVNRMQDIIDEMTEDKAGAKSNEHFANMNDKPKAKK